MEHLGRLTNDKVIDHAVLSDPTPTGSIPARRISELANGLDVSRVHGLVINRVTDIGPTETQPAGHMVGSVGMRALGPDGGGF